MRGGGCSAVRTVATAGLRYGGQWRWQSQLQRSTSTGSSHRGAPGRRISFGPGQSSCSPIRQYGATPAAAAGLAGAVTLPG